MSKEQAEQDSTASDENSINQTDKKTDPPTEEASLQQPPAAEMLIDELKQELAVAEQKAQDYWEKALRVQADMENMKRRAQKDLEDTHKFALTGFAKELLPVIDSLELGLQAATGDSEEVLKFREGSELTLKQFTAALTKFNVEIINPLGQPFNAEQHQAMVMQEVKDAAPNTVINVFQKGYMLNGRLLRPAMVIVAKAPAQPEKSPPKQDAAQPSSTSAAENKQENGGKA
ncbi:MAG: nucleotide exchange factor GrpE [Gammaproteobacteria bacterium]|nr:nucleotide exchange factor GrpE [Gammaproteobacteria bacterium]